MKSMDKNSGDGGDSNKSGNSGGKAGSNASGGAGAGTHDPASLLDAASLFAYWGRDPAAAATAASNPLFSSQFNAAAGLGLLPNTNAAVTANDRYSMAAAAAAAAGHHHQNTMAVAASQAASLAGLHPASWWSMAQLAAQDYFSRLQASGLSPFPHPDLAAAFGTSALGLNATGAGGVAGTGSGGGNSGTLGPSIGLGSNSGIGSVSASNNKSAKSRKEKRQQQQQHQQQQQQQSLANSLNAAAAAAAANNPAAALAGMHGLVNASSSLGQGVSGMSAASGTGGAQAVYKSNSSAYGKSTVSSGVAAVPGSAYDPVTLHKELLAMQAVAAAAAGGAGNNNSSNGSSSKKSTHHAAHSHQGSSGNSVNANISATMLACASGGNNSSKNALGNNGNSGSIHHLGSVGSASSQHHSNLIASHATTIGGGSAHGITGSSGGNASISTTSAAPHVTTSTSKDRDKNNASLNALNSLSQFGGALGMSPQQSVQAAMNAFAASNSAAAASGKAKEYIPSGILSAALEGNEHPSLLGVRLPPDTEIIKYTSSIVGPKIPGTTSRGRKKTISDEQQQQQQFQQQQQQFHQQLQKQQELDSTTNAFSSLLAFPGLSPAKRARLEMEYAAIAAAANAAVHQQQHQHQLQQPQQHMSALGTANSSTNLSTAITTPQANVNTLGHLNAGASAGLLAGQVHTNASGLSNTTTALSSHANSRENSVDRVEVIKLPPTITSNGSYNLSNKNKDFADLSTDPGSSAGVNLSMKSSTVSCSANNTSLAGSASNPITIDDFDAPLNLSMKPADKTAQSNNTSSDYSNVSNNVGSLATITTNAANVGPNSLQSLSSITAALGNNAAGGVAASSNNNASNNNSNSCAERTASSFKEGRPRNLGRGVSKPKKNTVASLLAQSRAVGLKPMLATQQLLQQGADIEKIRQALNEANAQMELSTDSESVAAESGLSESESEDANLLNVSELRVPLEIGWKRETVIRGLTKAGQIRGEVVYYAPGTAVPLKTISQVFAYLEKNPSKLTRENFSFSSRAIVGSFLQPAPPPYANDGEYIRMTDDDVAKRLEDLKIFTRQTLNVEQRIEIAKQQQAIRDAKKQQKEEVARNKEKARLEKNEKLEMQRKEKELKNQQAMEARKKRQEELDRIKQEELVKKQQELNKQKEMLLAAEMERERRRQHMLLVRQLDIRRKFEERERKKHQMVLDRLILREQRLATRKRDADILSQIRKPQEDSEVPHPMNIPELERIAGNRLPGQAMADLLMVFEFLHNFGETLGFDMESLPSLQNLHDALISESTADAEEELLSVMTHLLVCAIEDPGIPNPGRHTTLLGQSLRNADITNSNVSEILRIYLYATATGEIRQMFGITMDRERERRIPDHHQIDADTATHSIKNQEYYKHLHENETWKLSHSLKDRPFVALNPTRKAQILAHLCNDLLMNKAVLKQIDGSLETCAQMRKEKYMTDMKVRKYKALHMRKSRIEAYEKVQAEREAVMLAAAAQHKLDVERQDQETITTTADADKQTDSNTDTDKDVTLVISDSCETIGQYKSNNENSDSEKMEVDNEDVVDAKCDIRINSEVEHSNENLTAPTDDVVAVVAKLETTTSPSKSYASDTTIITPIKQNAVKLDDLVTHSNYQNGSGSNTLRGATVADFNAVVTVLPKSSDVVMMDDDLSDLESEITNVEEDEDNRLSADELQKKLDKIIRSSINCKEALEKSTNQLRAACFGQDRFWRRYWKLPKAGGIFIEALESAQNDIFRYNEVLEIEDEASRASLDHCKDLTTANDSKSPEQDEVDSEAISDGVVNKSLFSNCLGQDETAAVAAMDTSQMSPSAGEEKSEKANVEVAQPWPSKKVEYVATTDAKEDNDSDDVIETKVEPEIVDLRDDDDDDDDDAVGGASVPKSIQEASVAQSLQADSTAPLGLPNQLDSEANSANKEKISDKTEIIVKSIIAEARDSERIQKTDDDIKKEDDCIIVSATSGNVDKWFSIVSREIPLTTSELQADNMAASVEFQITYANITCESSLQMQGHHWEIANNAQYFTIPLEDCKADTSKLVQECFVSLSGLDNMQIEQKLCEFEEKYSTASKNGQASPCHRLKSEADDNATSGDEEHKYDDIEMATTNCYNQHDEKKFFPFFNDMKIDSEGQANANVGDSNGDDMKMSSKLELKLDEAMGISFQNLASMSLSNLSTLLQYDVPTPLSMTPDEYKLLTQIKKEGFPPKVIGKYVKRRLRFGWWKLDTFAQLRQVIESLDASGLRERELQENLIRFIAQDVQLGLTCQLIGAVPSNEFMLPDQPTSWNPKVAKRVELALLDQLEALEDKIASASMQLKNWQLPSRIETEITIEPDDITEEDFVSIIPMMRERLIDLELNIERRYLKPPLGSQTGDAHLAVIAQNQQMPTTQTQNSASAAAFLLQMQQQQQQQLQLAATAAQQQQQLMQSQQHQQLQQQQLQNTINASAFNERAMAIAAANAVAAAAAEAAAAVPAANTNDYAATTPTRIMPVSVAAMNDNNNSGGDSPASNCDSEKDGKVENLPKGLVSWRDAVARSHTTAQLAMALYVLESCVAWDKSIMKANCQFCTSGENEDQLLLCDGCDKGYHTYCFKPKMDNIPEGDWYCYECVNKATNERKCIVCGGHRVTPVGKMIYCDLCPRAYHADCYIPPLLKVPRGKWYCHGCISKAPPPKKRTNSSKSRRDRDSTSRRRDRHNSSYSADPQAGGADNMLHNLSHQSLNSSHDESMNSLPAPLSPAHSIASTTFDEHQNNSLDSSARFQAHHQISINFPQSPYIGTGTGSADYVGDHMATDGAITAAMHHSNIAPAVSPLVLHHAYTTINNSPLPLIPQQIGASSSLPPPTTMSLAKQDLTPLPHNFNNLNTDINPKPNHQSVDVLATPLCPAPTALVTAQPMASALQQAQPAVGVPDLSTPLTVKMTSPQHSTTPLLHSPRAVTPTLQNHPSPPHQSQQQHQQPTPLQPMSPINTTPSPGTQAFNIQAVQDAKEKLKQEKKEKHATKKLMKELAVCKTLLSEMELHEDSWPFLLPVNTKQFPTYRKIIKNPMDLSTIKKRLQDLTYKCREDFCIDVRQIFDNCEMFNEDDSPVGKAGHGMRKFFEVRWAELTDKHS